MTDLTMATASELNALYQSGTVSPVTVAEQVLTKIERLNPVFNAFCFTDSDVTVAQAKASEQRWQQSRPLSSLDGLPFAVKDSILTQGWPTLHGSLSTDPNQAWTQDDPVVARLKKAGAVLVGKTTTSEFGSGFTTDSRLNGITRNPWNPQYTSGGSSGGSAVAVSTGMVPMAIGSDYIGSIRTPAAFCGVTGFKPTHGLIPSSYVSQFECSGVGPIARCVNDIAMALNIAIDTVDLTKIRIAYCPDLGFVKNINNEIACAIEQVAKALSQTGAQITTVNTVVDDPGHIIGSMYLIDTYKHWTQLSNKQRRLTGRAYQYWAFRGSRLKQSVEQIQLQQSQLQQHMTAFMQSYDIILSPSTAVNADAFLADNIDFDHKKVATDYVPFGYLFNLSHQPAVTVPVGLNHRSMPIGAQLAGAVGADALVLAVAKLVQSMFPMPACPVILK